MRSTVFIIVMILVWTAHPSNGQQLLFHKNRNKEAIYKTGDVISFSTKEDGSRLTSMILGFVGDSLIVFQNYTINPRSITCLYADEKTMGWYPLRYKIDKILFIAGVGYPLLEVVNEGLIHRSRVDPEVFVVGGSLVGASFLARWLISEKIRVKGRRKLLIVNREDQLTW